MQNQGVGKLAPSEVFRGGPVPDSSSSWWAQCPWLVAVSLQSLSTSSHGHYLSVSLSLHCIFSCVSVSSFPLIRTSIILD